MLFLCECGCEVFEEELIILRDDGVTRQRRCPEHKLPNIKRVTQCKECGTELLSSVIGRLSILCKECRYEEHKKESREKAREKAAARVKAGKSPYKRKKKKPIIFSDPVRVWSIPDAVRKSVYCIPLKKLFKRRVVTQ